MTKRESASNAIRPENSSLSSKTFQLSISPTTDFR